MATGIWQYLKHFTVNEKSESGGNAWGDYTKCNGLLLKILDEIRDISGFPIVVHCMYEPRDGSNSEHKRGNAVDFHMKGCTPQHAYNCIIKVLSKYNLVDKSGLGYYDWWVHRGWHLDLRGYKLRWLSVKSLNYVYDEKQMLASITKAGIVK